MLKDSHRNSNIESMILEKKSILFKIAIMNVNAKIVCPSILKCLTQILISTTKVDNSLTLQTFRIIFNIQNCE